MVVVSHFFLFFVKKFGETVARVSHCLPRLGLSISRQPLFASPETIVQQISLFPTVEGQIENIAQAQAEEKSSAFSFVPRTAVSQEVIDRILTSGGSENRSTLRIMAFYQKGLNNAAIATMLQKEYRTGGKGFKIDGREYALWFDADGLRIAPGRTTNISGYTLVSWEQAAADIGRLLNDGQYASKEKLEAIPDNERKEISEKLWYLCHDFSEEAREQGVMPLISAQYEKHGGFPDSTKEIAELLKSAEWRNNLLTELAEFVTAFKANPELLRFRLNYNPKELWARLADLGQEPVAFPSDPNFKPERPTFVTNDELDNLLTRGSNVSEGKMRIYSFYMQGHDLKERVKFLRDEYGTGGSGYTGYNEIHDSKGISLTRADEISGYDGYDTVRLNWNRVEKRIGELIASGRYMSQKDLDYIPAYEKQQLAQNIYHFYSGLPLDVERPFPESNSYYDIKNTTLPLIDDHAAMEKIHAHMTETMTGIEPDNRHYAYNRRALDNVTAFMNGSYSLFTRLPDKVLQADRQEKEAAKKESKQQAIPMEPKAPVDDLAAAARSLARKKSTNTRENDNGQLSFDFAAVGTAEQEPVTLPQIAAPIDEDEVLLAAHADVLNEAETLLEERGYAVSDELLLDALEQLAPDADPTAEEIANTVEGILLDDEQEVTLSQYDLGYGHLGNGLTVWNTLEQEDGDYKTIAHISPDRTVTFYDDALPDIIREQVEQIAATSEMTVSATQDAPVFHTPPTQQEVQIPEEVPVQGAENLSDTLFAAFQNSKMDAWQTNIMKHRRIKKALYDVLNDESQTERIFNIFLNNQPQNAAELQNYLELSYHVGDEVKFSFDGVTNVVAITEITEDDVYYQFADLEQEPVAMARHEFEKYLVQGQAEVLNQPHPMLSANRIQTNPQKSPADLYHEYLPKMLDRFYSTVTYQYLRNNKPNREIGIDETRKQLDRMVGNMEDVESRDFRSAYVNAPLFSDWLASDIYDRVPGFWTQIWENGPDLVTLYANDADAPKWVRTGATEPDLLAEKQDNAVNPPTDLQNTPDGALEPARDAVLPPEKSIESTDTPNTKLYRESLANLIDMVRWHSDYSYLRDEDTDYKEAETKLAHDISQHIGRIKEKQPALYEAYTSLPLFREWLIEDILKFTYQVDTITDYRDAVARHANELDAPDWLREAEPVPAPKQPKRELPVLNSDAYLNLKAQHPDKIIGVHVEGMTLYYGTDAEIAAPALGKKLVTREVVGLGETVITGTARGWAADLVKLVEKGNSVLFVGDNGAGGYETIKERTAAEYIPIGMELTIDGRRMQIDSVDFSAGKVSLRDMELTGWFPIFRSESIPFVRSFIEEQQFSIETFQPTFEEISPQEQVPQWVEVDGGAISRTVIDLVPEPPTQTQNQNRQNFHITDNELGAGGQKAKYQANVTAIRTLKQLETEKRLATPEEQETLSKYVGWGGIADAFDPTRENWSKEYAELKELLTPAEYESARSSVLNAHYTSPTVIKAIYNAVEHMDFKPGNVLEPAMGVGNFFGLVPESMAASKLYGIELDSLTGRISKQLYQKADITVAGFETTDRRDFYDLAVGNVPFGEYKVADRSYDKLGFSIHDYFLAKSLDQLRPGGIMAVITSRYTMDKKGTEVRKYLAQKGDLLGAIRLPNNAFKANAGTEVVSDILFFQKRDRAPEREPDWVQTGKTADDLTLNNYFLQHPDMVLGELTTKSTQYGHEELTVVPIPEADLSNQLAEAIQNIAAPNRELLESDSPAQEDGKTQRDSLPADPRVRNFSYTIVDGNLYFRENSRMNPVEMGVTPAARVRGMVGLRDSARRLIDLQLQGAPDAEIDKEQANLNTLYDKFGKQYGLINSPANKQAFEQDSAYPLLCSLEVIDEEGKLEKKADMFSKRTIQRPRAVTSVDTASEALAVSIGEKAYVDLGYMGALMGGSDKIEGIIKDLQGVIFKDPLSDPDDLHTGWQAADEYLSGNVREKLAVAREAAETHPEFAVNVEMLEKIQPKELTAAEIDVRIGATWIDPKFYKQFMFELLQTPRDLQRGKIDIRYAPITGEWNVKGKNENSKNNARAYATYGTKRVSAYAIIENALNLRDTRVWDTAYEDGKEVRVLNAKETAIAQQKQEAIGEAFRDWIFKTPERREELCQTYNELYNSTRPREFDGSHINYVGMNPEIHMRPHQSNAVAHMLYGHNTLLAHCVGAGKTFEMIAAALESKRLGLCQKSLVVVPNHLTEQWGGDFLRLYPGANVLVATKKDFEKANRKKFCARIATGDYDAVIIGHSQFEKIPLSAARQEVIIQDEISEIIDAIQDAKDNDGERYTIKQMEKSKKNLETRLKKLAADERKDSVVTFEELGVDKLFVDEAHGFKNLFLHTKMRNVAGIGQSEAQKSSDMFGKCRYMDELTGGRGVIFATGTPVSNSMVELYTMMRYLQYDTLQKQGLGHFDSWAANFGEKVTAIELSPEGTGFRAKTRFAKFFNLPELMNLWKEAADIQTADMLKLPVPEAEYITVTTEPSEHQQAMVADLADRAKDVRDRKVEPNVDNMLRITGDGRKLALDQRLQNDLLPDDPDSKVNACVKNVLDVWEESTDIKGTQLVFCDLSTPHYDGTFNVYDDIKNKLIERGIPPQEISFIHDANTETQKAELFAKVRKGQVRVLIGSTQKMGAGTNVQDRLVASHDLDCPWRPADLEQRAGRILRQGNMNKRVKMFKYVTKGTFDAYNWSLVENKQKFIGQIMTSKSPARSAEDIDATALSYAEVKALATGDLRFKEKMDLDIQVAKLKLLKSNHTAQQYEMEDKVVKYYPQKIAESGLYIEALTADLPVLEAHPAREDAFTMTVMRKVYTERKDAGEAIIEVCKTMTDPDQKIDLGEYRGFPMKLSLDGEKFKVTMKQNLSYTAELSSDASGNITRINNAVEKIPENLENHKVRLAELQTELASAKEEAARLFPKEAEFAEKSARLNQLNIELDMTGKGQDGGEPEQENEPDEPPRDSGGKPSILKALKQFEQSAPAHQDRGRGYDREVM